MARYLANENVAAEAVAAARMAGHDLAWIGEESPGIDDDAVLQRSVAENRVLVTFDKDFGEMVFREGKESSCGVILLRPRLKSPKYLAEFLQTVLAQENDWEGRFTVAQEGKIRIVPLPD